MAETEIPVSVLLQRMSYDPETGILRWKDREQADFPTYRAFRVWSSRWPGKEALVGADKHGYRKGEILVDGKRYPLQAHRVAFAMFHGRHPKDQIDHINGDPSDNRISNLRECSHQQNVWNTVRKGKHLAGARPTSDGRWLSAIRVYGAQRVLGTFATEGEAHAAYMAAAVEIRGEFAPVGRDPDAGKRRNPKVARVVGQSHCPQGHELAGENLYVSPSGSRICRECSRHSVRVYRAKKEAAAIRNPSP